MATTTTGTHSRGGMVTDGVASMRNSGSTSNDDSAHPIGRMTPKMAAYSTPMLTAAPARNLTAACTARPGPSIKYVVWFRSQRSSGEPCAHTAGSSRPSPR